MAQYLVKHRDNFTFTLLNSIFTVYRDGESRMMTPDEEIGDDDDDDDDDGGGGGGGETLLS
jgi:hypothetical protein